MTSFSPVRSFAQPLEERLRASRVADALRRVRAWVSRPRSGAESAGRASRHWSGQGAGSRTGGARDWTELAAVQARINRRVSGDPLVDPYAYVLRRYFDGKLPVERAATLGCGSGELERGLARYGFCRRHDAFDFAEASVRRARDAAREAGLAHVAYHEVDVNGIRLEPAVYDCVWGVSAVHHLTALEHVFAEVERGLKPGGLFVLNEFVGPSKFQWTDRQLEVVNGLLAALPPRLKERCGTGRGLKRRVRRPTLAEMDRIDPSEAARSAEIVPLLSERFELLETRGYGGSVLMLLLFEIAWNFADGTEGAPLLEALCDVEERLVALGDLPDDHALIVARRR